MSECGSECECVSECVSEWMRVCVCESVRMKMVR